MKLKIFNFSTLLDLNKSTINIVEIEEVRLFRKVIETLQFQMINEYVEEKIYIFDDNYNEINYRDIDLVTNYIDLFSSIKVTNELVKILEKQLSEEQEELIYKLNISLNEFAFKMLYDLDIDIEYKESYQMKDLLPVLKLNIIDNGNILENLFTAIDLYTLFESKKYIFFVNLKSYLDEEELIEIYRYIVAKELKVILLEGRASDKILNLEQKFYIDDIFDDHYELYDTKI